MKAIMISIRPQWVAKILNGEKTIEIRKMFPSDYVGWVYIYVTRDRNETLSYQVIPHDRKRIKGYNGFNDKDFDFQFMTLTKTDINNGWGWFAREHNLNGKVVARFWCDKVEEIELNFAMRFFTKSMNEEELLKQSCLASKELENYLLPNLCYGKAIHITKLEIFDKPKDIKDFSVYSHKVDGIGYNGEEKTFRILKPLARAPQNYCYIEV